MHARDEGRVASAQKKAPKTEAVNETVVVSTTLEL
jgi:hypothetical protein